MNPDVTPLPRFNPAACPSCRADLTQPKALKRQRIAGIITHHDRRAGDRWLETIVRCAACGRRLGGSPEGESVIWDEGIDVPGISRESFADEQ
jgi:hypothetical protein